MSALPDPPCNRLHAAALILLIFLASRFVLIVIGVLTLSFDQAVYPFDPNILLSLGVRWDSDWYLSIINGRYNPIVHINQPGATNFAFFPLYPLLVATVQQGLDISAVAAGILVSNLAFIAALWLIFNYVRLLGLSGQVGLMTVLLLCFVPQGFVFSAIYTESVFLLLLTAAMYALRCQHYLTAGLCAALLSATRANGVFFVVFAGVWLLRQYGLRPLWRPWAYAEPLLPIALAPLGLFAFWWYCFLTTGDAFAQATTALHGWGWTADFPWRNLARHLTSAYPIDRFWVVCSLLAGAFSLALLPLKRYEEFLLCLSILLLYWTGMLPNSLLRYSIVLFPIFIGIASLLERRPLLFWLLLGLSGLLNGFLMTAWTTKNMISI